MAFNAIPNVVKCSIRHSFRGQDCLNTTYFLKSAGSITVGDVGALLAGLADIWSTTVMPLLSNDLNFLSILARDLTTANGIELIGNGGSAGVGGAGDAMPNNVSACVSLRTPFAGRHYRGRIYLGGIPRDAVAENSLDPAFQSDMMNALAQLIGDGIVATGWQWVVVAQSQTTPGSDPPVQEPIPGGIVTPITDVVFVDGVVDSQRRRLPGRGR